jgi:peptide/nickel transport system substrate-binding protein
MTFQRTHVQMALNDPRPSRRAFLRTAAGLAIAAPVAAACSRFGGRESALRVALAADPAGLSPLLQTGLVEASVYANVYDSLVALDGDGQLTPALAESWRAIDDRTWELRLRSGVTFHNGERFDASAVRFTIETLLDPASSSPIRAQLAAIERVETPEPLVARIVTRQPFAPLLAELTGVAIIPPGHTASVGVEGLGERPVGTGAFRFVERVRDDRIVLEANRGHWRGRPGVERLEFRPIPDAATRLAALRAGQVDLATNVASEQESVLTREGLRVLARPGVQTLYLRLNTRRPQLQDVRVRRALAQAIDVDRIITTVYGGRARRVSAPFPPDVFGYDPNAAPTPYDPAAARALLSAAGAADGLRLVFETPRGRYPKDDQIPQVVAGYFQEVGVQTELRTVEWAAYLQKVNAGQGEDVFLLAGTNRIFDPHFTMTRLYASASSFGRDYYGNPTIDTLAADAAATLDVERRRALYGQLLDILRADVPAIWLAQLDDLYGARPGVSWQPRPDSLLWLHGASIAG